MRGTLDVEGRDLRFIDHSDGGDAGSGSSPLKSHLRFRNRTRCLVGIRGLAASMAARSLVVSVEVTGPLHAGDADFLEVLRQRGVLSVVLSGEAASEANPADEDDVVQGDAAWIAGLELDDAGWLEARRRISRYLRCGDSWTARWLLEIALRRGSRPPVEVLDLCGLIYQLQELPEPAAYFFGEAVRSRGRYGASAANSLAMSFARHLPRALRDLERADHYLDLAFEILGEDPDPDAVALETALNWNSRAYLRMVAGRPAEALEVMRAAVCWLPAGTRGTQAHAVLVNNLGRLLQRSEPASSEIEPLLREATDVEPQHPEFWLDLAMYLGDAGRYEEAMAAATSADALTGSIAEIPALRGFLHSAVGDHAAAIAEYRRSLRIDPTNADTLVSACRTAAAAEDYPEVLRLSGERAGELGPDAAADLELLVLEARSFVEELSMAELRDELDRLAHRFPESENVRASLTSVEQAAV
ncbi:hypothetical protein [Paractinoplanes maris]|uniref:hypothetical protein n=1 Tax=Paractinoplanes maris TaxID=1734446 RepID=UPI0020205A8E|nr:hypothetical protein [Actinoplanes maris]